MGFIADIGSLGESIFGSDEKESQFGTRDLSQIVDQSQKGFATEQLILDPAAIQKIIQDVLGAEDGLASILSGEQNAGIFNSSVAQGQATDLVQGLVGELAKLTGKKVGTQESETRESTVAEEVTTNEKSTESAGLLETSGLSAISDKMDPSGTVGSIRDKKNPLSSGVEDQISRYNASKVEAEPATRFTDIDQRMNDATTPQTIQDVEEELSLVEQGAETAIADAVLSLFAF